MLSKLLPAAGCRLCLCCPVGPRCCCLCVLLVSWFTLQAAAAQAAADVNKGATLISLPSKCHLTYDGSTDPRLLALIDQVPAELWGAKLALQASTHFAAHAPCTPFMHCHTVYDTALQRIHLPLPQVVAQRLLGEASPFNPYIRNLPMVRSSRAAWLLKQRSLHADAMIQPAAGGGCCTWMRAVGMCSRCGGCVAGPRVCILSSLPAPTCRVWRGCPCSMMAPRST